MIEYINKFLNGKCEEVMKKFPNESIDMILTSPPYADRRFYGTDEFKIKPDNYVDWFMPKAYEVFRVLKNGGNFILNISDTVTNGEQHIYAFELLIKLKKEIGFTFVRDYIWHNPATPPNVYSSGRFGRTKKSHEYCFWLAKGDTWTFNLDPIRKPYGKDMEKYLNGQGKGNRDANTRPSTHNFNCEKVWENNGGADPGSVITVGNTNSNDDFIKMCREVGMAHPARFPEKLAEFFILSGSNEGDIVLDPFSGSGTTAVVAQRYRRGWIGIDANEVYCKLAQMRVEKEFGRKEEETETRPINE